MLKQSSLSSLHQEVSRQAQSPPVVDAFARQDSAAIQTGLLALEEAGMFRLALAPDGSLLGGSQSAPREVPPALLQTHRPHDRARIVWCGATPVFLDVAPIEGGGRLVLGIPLDQRYAQEMSDILGFEISLVGPQGELAVQVPETRDRETATLARAFNFMKSRRGAPHEELNLTPPNLLRHNPGTGLCPVPSGA